MVKNVKHKYLLCSPFVENRVASSCCLHINSFLKNKGNGTNECLDVLTVEERLTLSMYPKFVSEIPFQSHLDDHSAI